MSRPVVHRYIIPGDGNSLVRAEQANDLQVAGLRPDLIETAIFWMFIAGLAWVPFWYASNDWLAWGINAMIFPGLAGVYEVSLLARNKPHPVALTYLLLPFALFAFVVLWTGFQVMTLPHDFLANPIWGMTAGVLGHPLTQSVSVNRDLTFLALIRLVTAACTFWLALQLCRDGRRANLFIDATVVIAAAYALYGLVAMRFGQLPLLDYIPSGSQRLHATFINPDSYATYAGIGFITIVGLILRHYGDEMRGAAGSWRLQLAAFIEQSGGWGAALLASGFLTLTALLLTGSRAGLIATGFGLFVLFVLSARRGDHAKGSILLLSICFVLVAATLVAFGNVVGSRLADGGIYDRLAVYKLVLRSIWNKPFLGWGYGTFPDVFPMYRDRSIGVLGTWSQAHNTYLEIFQGLGVIGGALLLGCVIMLIAHCVKGTTARMANITLPCIAASTAFLVGAHALVDFSLQTQAVAITFTAILGVGVAQSESSQRVLED